MNAWVEARGFVCMASRARAIGSIIFYRRGREKELLGRVKCFFKECIPKRSGVRRK